jgi:hypothetical protein
MYAWKSNQENSEMCRHKKLLRDFKHFEQNIFQVQVHIVECVNYLPLFPNTILIVNE